MRPQLLDRFGMCVNVTTMLDGGIRVQMLMDKLAYEQVHSPRPLNTPHFFAFFEAFFGSHVS